MQDFECAEYVISIIPKIMWSLRKEVEVSARGEITLPQYRALFRLSESAATHQEVTASLGITAPTFSRLADTLIKKKWVTKTPDPHDKRRALLSLTPEGSHVQQTIRFQLRDRVQASLAGLTQKELNEITNGLTSLFQSVQNLSHRNSKKG